jgi:hypothetical protein
MGLVINVAVVAMVGYEELVLASDVHVVGERLRRSNNLVIIK